MSANWKFVSEAEPFFYIQNKPRNFHFFMRSEFRESFTFVKSVSKLKTLQLLLAFYYYLPLIMLQKVNHSSYQIITYGIIS